MTRAKAKRRPTRKRAEKPKPPREPSPRRPGESDEQFAQRIALEVMAEEMP